MTNITKHEIKTVINYNVGEQTVTVYTRDKSVLRKINRLVANYSHRSKLLRQTDMDRPI